MSATTPPTDPSAQAKVPMLILLAACIAVLLAMGIRASFGIFQIPIVTDRNWDREVFAFAMALQNLCWGAFQPFAGAIADKWGYWKVVGIGGILYAVGIFFMAEATEPGMFDLTGGVLIGMAQAGCGLAVVMGAVSQLVPVERRSWVLGIISAAGSAGQIVVIPFADIFRAGFGWYDALLIMAGVSLLIAVMSVFMRPKDTTVGKVSGPSAPEQTITAALREAFEHRGYWLLTVGFFVCGFHVAFVAVHLPAYLEDMGMPESTGAWALALVGGFNVLGCFVAGWLGGKHSKPKLLSALYLLRALVFVIFITLPTTIWSVLFFSAALGLLWLSTVPLTSGLVAQIFGPRYMTTLFSIVFFSHQLGSFMGIWLGGVAFDETGSYLPVWWAGVAVGIIAAALHWPIDDRSVEGQRPAPAN